MRFFLLSAFIAKCSCVFLTFVAMPSQALSMLEPTTTVLLVGIVAHEFPRIHQGVSTRSHRTPNALHEYSRPPIKKMGTKAMRLLKYTRVARVLPRVCEKMVDEDNYPVCSRVLQDTAADVFELCLNLMHNIHMKMRVLCYVQNGAEHHLTNGVLRQFPHKVAVLLHFLN